VPECHSQVLKFRVLKFRVPTWLYEPELYVRTVSSM
jgi:hypothetical protein